MGMVVMEAVLGAGGDYGCRWCRSEYSRKERLLRLDLFPQVCAALVFLFPIVCAVDFPALAEVGGEAFGQDDELDMGA